MKVFFLYCFLIVGTVAGLAQTKMQTINAILADESYLSVFGVLPDESTHEQQRIQIHLAYTEQLLRNADVQNLACRQQVNRAVMLDLLHQYRISGNFPVNRDYPGERRPCFIDADGNICAVGYLIEQTKGREFAEAINKKHQYDFLMDMDEPAIEEWAREFGLTLAECAMIQPTYGSPPADQTSYADIKTGYGISSGLVGGMNLAINIAHLSTRFKHDRAMSYLGLLTGTGQVIMGIANVKRTTTFSSLNGWERYTSYKAQNNLSYVNIALGTSTIITSALNLALQKKIKEKRSALNLYSYPGYNSSMAMGLCFTRKI